MRATRRKARQAFAIGGSCRAAAPSPINILRGHSGARGFDVNLAVGRRLQGGDEGLAREIAGKSAEFFCRDDDDFVPAMHGHELRSFAARASHELAEARLGVMQPPVSRWQRADGASALR